ncbi:hypothetical protein HHK36_004795 [Tetracentron sinense]|uniref:Patellin-4 n=1 Tax=Tetracentron sinense TaxID=13715 RepID=A0A834ZUC1_TETSI|nr:hypothetical protein HHK36_004795 [Tetracentron sinense]
MTAEVKSEDTQIAEVVVPQQEEPTKVADETVVAVEAMKVAEKDEPRTVEVEEKKIEAGQEELSPSPAVEKSSSFREESTLLSDLREYEKKALIELKSKLEEAILGNNLFKKKEDHKDEKKEEEKPLEGGSEEKEIEKPAEEGEKSEKSAEEGEKSEKSAEEGKKSEKSAEEGEKSEKSAEEGKKSEKSAEEGEKSEKSDVVIEEKTIEFDKDISLWGVPLFPSKGSEGTDVILLKFLRAREFRVNEAFEMLKNTLQWRKEFKIDSILDEDLGADLSSVAYMNGVDREGHPICYNIYGVFGNSELYNKTFGTDEKRELFLRWRFQLMEKGIQKLEFKSGGVSSLLQINDLKNSPGLSKKELRVATKQAVGLLQDNYPEFVARNIFINVPFWYYAFNALLSPFLTQRTKSKFVFARPAKVTETLLKYIPAEEIPIQYGGLKRENDLEFSIEDGAISELIVKAGSTETIEIPAPEVGNTFLWDLTVLGWEVNYKEEFVPNDEGSYTIIIQKGNKMGSQEGPIRNSFRNNEPGKVVLSIENGTYKKKRVLYRYKTKKSSST